MSLPSARRLAPAEANLRCLQDPTTSCICELSGNIDRVQTALDNTAQKASKVNAKFPPRLATLDVPAVISHLRDRVDDGSIVNRGFWASGALISASVTLISCTDCLIRAESKWTVKAAELIMIFGACFDRVYAKLDVNVYATAMPKIARFLGGVATFSAASRLSNWLVSSNPSELHQTSGWPAFAEEYADSYMVRGELSAVSEHERASLAEEQDRKVSLPRSLLDSRFADFLSSCCRLRMVEATRSSLFAPSLSKASGSAT